ncbi:MAG: hypothetical protein WCD42_08520, partial [Rhizomicrobium sp.]
VKHLLEVMTIKQLCRAANVEKIEAGPKGAVIGFRGSMFANPAGLVGLITKARGSIKVRPDQKIVVARDWPEAEDRLKGVKAVLTQLAKLAKG